MINEKVILQLSGGNGDDQEVSFIVKPIFDDPGTWGVLLVDSMHHIANAYAAVGGIEKEEVLERIKEIFDLEWHNPTDPHHGNLLI